MKNRAYTPPGWPERVRPPGAPEWESTASAFLFDCCPPDFRMYPVLRRHPVVLARFAVISVEAQREAAERGVAEVRTVLRDRVDPRVIGDAVDAWSEQAARLIRTRRAVGLVEEALLGRVFVPRLADAPQQGMDSTRTGPARRDTQQGRAQQGQVQQGQVQRGHRQPR